MKKMKWMWMTAALIMTGTTAWGSALISKGSNELAIGGKLDFATEAGTDLNLNVKYAYFFWNRFSLGARVSMHNNDAMNHFGLGGIAEYNFALPGGYKPLFGTDLVPYLAGTIDYRHAKLFDEKESSVVFGAEGGLKFFLTDMTAVTLSLVGELATEEIYADELEATDKDLSLQVGMRFYF
ncbi:MAG: hypothetical protein GX548_03290 [Lentisphaerae bacterium]|mgnify:CR=1 FL=1|nr:hypothetical protein [Lentisphaerota bacterium]